MRIILYIASILVFLSIVGTVFLWIVRLGRKVKSGDSFRIKKDTQELWIDGKFMGHVTDYDESTGTITYRRSQDEV